MTAAPDPAGDDTADRITAREAIAAWADHVAAEAPPLSEGARERLRTLLTPGARVTRAPRLASEGAV